MLYSACQRQPVRGVTVARRLNGREIQGAHGSRPVMIEERVGAQYQNWYERSRVIPSATS